MSVALLEPPRWTTRRWIQTVALAFLAQAALIFILVERQQPVPSPPKFGTKIQLAADGSSARSLTELSAVSDPTAFALPNAHGFSGAAWLTFAPLTYQLTDWTEPPRWLAPDARQLGQAFAAFVATNASPPLLIADKPLPRLAVSAGYAPADPRSTQSVLRLEDDLARRPLVAPLALPSWPHTDVLTNSIVQLLVDAEGQTLSAVLLATSGLSEADDYALKLAGGARFQPLRRPDGRPDVTGPLGWGKLIFQWHTIASPTTNVATANP